MLLLLLHLKDERRIHKVVEVLLELELSDATVVDSESVANLAVHSDPLFSEIGSLFGQKLSYQRTLFVRLPARSVLRDLVRLCARSGVDLADPETASLWVIPCEGYTPGAEDGDPGTPGG